MTQFAEDMRQSGHDREIVNESHIDDDDDGDDDDDDISSRKVSREDYVLEVRDLMKRTRGRELPGTFNPMIIGDFILPTVAAVEETPRGLLPQGAGGFHYLYGPELGLCVR